MLINYDSHLQIFDINIDCLKRSMKYLKPDHLQTFLTKKIFLDEINNNYSIANISKTEEM